MYVYTYVLCVQTVFKACFVCRFRRRSPPDRLPGMDVTFNILPVTHICFLYHFRIFFSLRLSAFAVDASYDK